MFPDLFSIGPLHFHSYGLLVAVGFLAATAFLTRSASRVGKTRDEIVDLVIVTALAGFFGARVFYVIYEFDYFKSQPLETLAIWKGGIIFYGGLFFGCAVFFVFTLAKKWPVLKTLDLFMPALALAQGFGRIGCFLNGCCYGKPTTCVLGVRFPFSEELLHPTQLYEAVFCFVLFFVLVVISKKAEKRPGTVSGFYFLLYAAGRFVIEFYRNDMPRLALGFTLGQWVSAAVFLAGFIFLLKIRMKSHAH